MIALLCIEAFIARYVHDSIIRPYIGDFLVVILMYCFVKSFFELTVLKAAVIVLLFAFGIETLQYLNVIGKLGLKHSSIAKTILGHPFSWMDLLAYTVGMIAVLLIEQWRQKK